MLDLAVIIVSWNVRDYLVDCLRTLYADLNRSGLKGAVWVVDNASTDGTQELLTNLFSQTALIQNNDNPGFGAANNQGMAAAMAQYPNAIRYFLLLNPDTLIRPGALNHLVQCLEDRPDGGVAGPKLVYGDGRFQHSAFYFPGLRQLLFELLPLPARLYESRLNGRYPRYLFQAGSEPFAVDHTLGAAMLVRRAVAEATEGFDESFHMYCEEIDWCWRIRQAGWTIYAVPEAEIVHYGGQSTRQVQAQSIINLWHSRARLYHTHHGRVKIMLASWLVKKAMQRRAMQTNNPELKAAYQKAASLWGNLQTS